MPRYTGDPRWIITRFRSKCSACGNTIEHGARAYYYPKPAARIFGETCCDAAKEHEADFNAAAFDEAFGCV